MRVEIEIKGKAYPCYPTTGAMLRFKDQTGRDISQMEPGSVSDLIAYLWACVASASRREGVEFDLPLYDFADNILPEDLEKWNATLAAANEKGKTAEKKS